MSALRKITAAVAIALGAASAQAQVSDGVVKIGVLSDMSSLYSDIGGPGSVIAARMAVEDFALEPEMMLLDEPTAGMTHVDVERITALVKRVAANRTVLMVEHNLSVVSSLSDRITVLQRGQILAEGDYQSVSKNPQVIEAYLGVANA